MSTSHLSKASLTSSRSKSSPKETEKADIVNAQRALLVRSKVEHVVDQTRSQVQREAHQKRLEMLIKEVTYVQNTAWMFQSID